MFSRNKTSVFRSIAQKDKNIHKDIIDTNVRLKNYCSQKTSTMSTTPVLTKTTWVLKSFTLTRKLMFAQNVVRYLPSKF